MMELPKRHSTPSEGGRFAPRRRFWTSERTFGNAFSKHFQMNVAQIEYSAFERYFENAFPNVRSAIQNLRLWSINFHKRANQVKMFVEMEIVEKGTSCQPVCIVVNKKVAFSALGEKPRTIGIRSVVKSR
jgi:hypothetical protein